LASPYIRRGIAKMLARVPMLRLLPRMAPVATRAFSSGESLVLVEKKMEEAVAVLTLNRPKALNALSDSLMTELTAKLKECEADAGIRAMVITGQGKAFAAGADIKEMSSRETYAAVNEIDMLAHWSGVSSIRKPIIAAVNGFALGGGCELAMSCDILLAGESAQFGQPEILLGTIPGVGGTQRLTRAVGKSKAMEWVLTGDRLKAAEAERAGLVSRVVPDDQLLDEAVKLGAKIAKMSAPVAAMAKDCVNKSQELALHEGLAYERRMFHATWALEDRKEGMRAFSAKEKATWVHK